MCNQKAITIYLMHTRLLALKWMISTRGTRSLRGVQVFSQQAKRGESCILIQQKCSGHKAVWFSVRIPKHAFITWVAARDIMVTRDRLLRWSLTVPSNCVLCAGNQENRQHLFFDCAYSNQAWTFFVSRLHLNSPPLPPAWF